MTMTDRTNPSQVDHLWYSVETPSVFCERKLPADESTWTSANWNTWHKLENLAEIHGTSIHSSGYQRG